MFCIRASKCVLLFFCFCFFALQFATPATLRADLPPDLKSISLDWVCVSVTDLVPAYEPLADHRRAQGLAARVLDLEEVLFWSPVPDDTTATLRWLAQVAVEQWQARYLLLGGSHNLLPAPLHSLVVGEQIFTHPTDAYFACLDGQWDVDGDGLVAEFEDDAADPTVHLRVGRLPLDDAQDVTNAVTKIMAFEQRPAHTTDGALFVSSLMDISWTPADPYPNWALDRVQEMRDQAVALRPSLRASTLFQGPQLVDPFLDPLNPVSLADSLGARAHDLVHFQLAGTSPVWELAQGYNINADAFDSLAGCGHTFLATMLSGSVADTRKTGILQHLLALPDGGAVAVLAPSGVGYIFPLSNYQELLWQKLLDGSVERLGEAHFQALASFFEGISESAPTLTTYWYLSLLGDPATLLQPMESQAATVPPPVAGVNLRVVPNPFNPVASIRFELTGEAGREVPVRVEIFNLQGKRVATLLEKNLLPGPQDVSWETAVPSGLYFARVTVDGRSSVIKLTLVE